MMRRILTMLAIFITAILLLGFTFITLRETQRMAASPEQRFFRQANPEGASGQEAGRPRLSASKRISIPFGFDPPLPLLDSGQSVQVRGQGGCTKEEQVTVAVTVTQAISGAVATAELQQPCTGFLQTWQVIAETQTVTPLAAGMAEACGLATTRAGGSVTDADEWCVDVGLVVLDRQVYLPLVLRE